MPPAVHFARLVRQGLIALSNQHPDQIGPDGKIVLHLDQKKFQLRWKHCNISLQHAPELGYESIFRLILPIIHAIKRVENWSDDKLRVNGMGDFSIGGPFSDNGLSGKKLVVDHYGPGVPIGGGALCGKDPHKVDRVGALRARQVAVRLVQSTGAQEALVYLGYLPGLSTPSILTARVDGEEWSEARIRQSVNVPDLSIEGSFRDLDLGSEKWLEVLLKGYFGNKWRWEA
jgi:S-adenosylmethionine synthetase